jgi:hypothetical protein
VSSRVPSSSRSRRSPPSTLLRVPVMEVDRFNHRHRPLQRVCLRALLHLHLPRIHLGHSSRHLLLGDLAVDLACGVRLPLVLIRWVDSILDRLDHLLAKRLATAAPVTPCFFSSLTSSRTSLSSTRSQNDNPKSHSFIFTGLRPVRRGRTGCWSTM